MRSWCPTAGSEHSAAHGTASSDAARFTGRRHPTVTTSFRHRRLALPRAADAATLDVLHRVRASATLWASRTSVASGGSVVLRARVRFERAYPYVLGLQPPNVGPASADAMRPPGWREEPPGATLPPSTNSRSRPFAL